MLLRFQFNAEINKRAYHKIPTTNLLQELHLLESLFISGEIDLVRFLFYFALYYMLVSSKEEIMIAFELSI